MTTQRRTAAAWRRALVAGVAILVACDLARAQPADALGIGTSVLRFASVDEGRAVLGSDDAWTAATSDFQRAATMGLPPPAPLDRFRDFLVATVQPWSAAREAPWRQAAAAIAPRIAELGVPLPAEVLLVASDGRDAAGAPYTRGRAVVLPPSPPPGARRPREAFVLAHELFHVVSRHDPELATRLYRTIGFESIAPLAWPAEWLPRRIANPDAPFDRHAMRLAVDGRDTWIVPLLVASRVELAPGETFFSVLELRLLEVVPGEARTVPLVRNGEPVWHRPQELPAYLERLGGNTGYILHPEETMADNFALLVTGTPAPNPALLARIEMVLRERR